jgi:hypothetical protein
MAAERCSGRNIAKDCALGGDPRPISDHQVIRDTHVPGENNVVPYPGAAGDSDACHDQAALANPYVMPDLHQVVQLGAATDNCVVDAAPIDAGIRPYFDFVLQDASTYVWNPGVPLSIREISKTVSPDHCSGLEHHAAADPAAGVAGHARPQNRVIAKDDAVPERYSLGEAAARTDLNVSTENHVRGHEDTSAKDRSGTYPYGSIHSGAWGLRWIECLQHTNQCAIRVGNYDPGIGPCPAGQGFRHQDRPSPRAVELGRVATRDGEGQGVGPGAVQWAHSMDPYRPIAKQAATDQIGDRLRGKAPDCHVVSCLL